MSRTTIEAKRRALRLAWTRGKITEEELQRRLAEVAAEEQREQGDIRKIDPEPSWRK